MTYAAEVRADTAETKRLMQTSEMRTVRMIAGHTLQDRVRNAELRQQTTIDDVVRWVRARRRQWNDHVSRMTDGRLARIARDGIPHGEKPLGRPPQEMAR